MSIQTSNISEVNFFLHLVEKIGVLRSCILGPLGSLISTLEITSGEKGKRTGFDGRGGEELGKKLDIIQSPGECLQHGRGGCLLGQSTGHQAQESLHRSLVNCESV